jgi:hypothetical protein
MTVMPGLNSSFAADVISGAEVSVVVSAAASFFARRFAFLAASSFERAKNI